MKKLLHIVAGIVLSLTLGLGANVMAFSGELPILDGVLEKVGMSRDIKRDTKELSKMAEAGEEGIPFENLYLVMLQNMAIGPHEAAIKNLSKRGVEVRLDIFQPGEDSDRRNRSLKVRTKRMYRPEELEQIITQGDITPITRNKDNFVVAENAETIKNEGTAGSNAFWEWANSNYSATETTTIDNGERTEEEVLQEYYNVMNLYDKEVALQRENRRLSYELMASEIFYNGDLSDSGGVDILADLDLVHFMIFGDYMELPEDGNVTLASEEFISLQNNAFIELASEDFDPHVCYEDQSLREALQNYVTVKNSLTPEGIDPETGAMPVISEAPFDASAENKVASTPQSTEDPQSHLDSLNQSLGFNTSLLPKSGWPCTERFCITVDLKTASWGTKAQEQGTVGAYDDRDDCIACHVAFINEAIDTTLSKSMIPGKVSMNFFEDATCKDAGSLINLDMNVYTVAKPIVLDPGDEMLEAAFSSFDAMTNQVFALNGIVRTEGTDLTTKSLEDIACGKAQNIGKMINRSGQTLEEALLDCAATATELKEQTDAFIDEFNYESKALYSKNMYEMMSARLYSMLLVFEDMEAALHETGVIVSDMESKPYCT